jgi:predicted transcriptional regulator
LQAILSNDDVVVDVAVARNEPFSVSAPSRKVAPPPRAVRAAPADGVSKSMQRVLDALAALEALGIAPAPRINAAFFAGYTENGHFNNMLGTLRTMGLLDYPSPAMIGLTDAGRATADASAASFDSLAEMHRVWLGKVSPSEGKLLQALIDAYPAPIERGLLAQQTGYTENGHFNNMLGHLRTLGVVEYPGNRQVAATDVLFPKGLR